MNKRFKKYLLAYSVLLLLLWVVFSLFILPLLPDPLKGSLSMLGFAICLVTLGYAMIHFYEKGED